MKCFRFAFGAVITVAFFGKAVNHNRFIQFFRLSEHFFNGSQIVAVYRPQISEPERRKEAFINLIDKNAFNSNDCDICMFNPYYDDDMRIEGEAEGMEV